jgi:hypothetical protein
MPSAPTARGLAFVLTASAIGLAGCSAGGSTSASGPASVAANSTAAAGITGPPSSQGVPHPTSTTATIPAPGGGSIRQTVATRPQRTNPPVGFSRVALFSGGLQAEVSKIVSMKAEGHGPGELTGPAFSMTIELKNGSGKAIDLSSVVVDVQDASKVSLSPVNDLSARPFTGSVAAGATATGVYLFTKPDKASRTYSMAIRYSADVPAVAFAGKLP